MAHSTSALLLGRTTFIGTTGWDPDASSLWRRHTSKSSRAFTFNILSIDAAFCIRATGSLLLAGVDALEVDADLRGWAIVIGAATNLTNSSRAYLVAGALLAGDAGNHAHAVCALLANQTVVHTTAGIPALTLVAG